MRKFSENRFLADLYSKDAVQAVFFQELIDRLDNVAKGAGVAMVGDLTPPPPVNAINVKASGEMLHVTLTHSAELNRAIEYHVEADTNPGFTAPQIVSQGSRRTHLFNLPGFTDSGIPQPWYIRAYAQYPGSKPSQPLVFGGLANPTPITLTGGAGGTKLTPLGSTGSGTASTTGQQGGSGRGKFRVSTPKVIRIGKQSAAVQPTQTTVQPGGQPVIIFTPQPNGSTPPTVVVDQSGNNGIDFAGGTPIAKRLTASGIAFADTTANLLLKNIANINGANFPQSITSTTFVTIGNATPLSSTITTMGNPILVIGVVNFDSVNANTACNFRLLRDSTQLGNTQTYTLAVASDPEVAVLVWIDSVAAGSHTFAAQTEVNNAANPINILAGTLQVVELG